MTAGTVDLSSRTETIAPVDVTEISVMVVAGVRFWLWRELHLALTIHKSRFFEPVNSGVRVVQFPGRLLGWERTQGRRAVPEP